MAVNIYAGISTDARAVVQSGDLNNTTASLTFDITTTSGLGFKVNDYVVAWDLATYATPDLDSAARVGIVTARTAETLTVTWGKFGTAITAIAGTPTVARLFADGMKGDYGRDVVLDGLSDTLVLTDDATTGTALDVPVSTLTTGVGIDVSDATALTTGKVISVGSSSTSITTSGRLFYSAHTGASATSAVLNEFASDAADETIIVRISANAALAAGQVLDLNASALTTGKVLDMSNLDAITTGKAIHVDATGVTQTDGILVHIDSASTALTSTGRLLLVDHTGNAGVSAVVAEVASAAADETTIMRVTASAALAAGVVLDLSAAAVTTGTVLDLGGLDALTTGTAVNVVSNSSSTGTRSLVFVKNDHASATGTSVLELAQDSTLAALKVTSAATSTNFFKIATMNGVTLWMGNGNTANAALSGTAGDIIFNAGSNKPEYCTGTTNWTALV